MVMRLAPILFLFLLFLEGNGQSVFQQQTPSILLPEDQWEYKAFNNLYTETQGFDQSGSKIARKRRASYFKSIHQFLYGLSPRINLGAEVWLGSVHTGPKGASPLETFHFQGSPNARAAPIYAGPRFKFTPLVSLERLSVESTWLIPIAPDLESRQRNAPYLAGDRYSWLTQIYYDQPLGADFQLFTRLAPWLSIDRQWQQEGTYFSLPASAFVSWFASDRWTIYIQNEFWPTFGTDPFLSSWFLQEGLGMKYQLIRDELELELLYTNFLLGRNSGAGQTFNLGIRWLGGKK